MSLGVSQYWALLLALVLLSMMSLALIYMLRRVALISRGQTCGCGRWPWCWPAWRSPA